MTRYPFTVETIDGKHIAVKTKEVCFSFLKSPEMLRTIKPTLHCAEIESITYRPLIEKRFEALIESYFDFLLKHPVIDTNTFKKISGKKIISEGINLPSTLSGSALVAIFSLFRYAEEHPNMIISWGELCTKYGLLGDKALYLSHFITTSGEKELASKYNNARPKNHSVINRTGRTIYKGGHLFYDKGIAFAAKLDPYNITGGYGLIQRLVEIFRGEVLMSISPNMGTNAISIGRNL